MARIQKHRPVSVNTPLGQDILLLAQFAGEEYISQPFEYRLNLLSEDYEIPFEDMVGGNVTVRMAVAGEQTRYFNGFVSHFVQTGQLGNLSRYHATVVPWLWFLTRTSDCRIFQEMSVPDIIKEVFQSNGFADFDDALTGTYEPRTYCVQYRETDFNFVSRLMEDVGIYYYFEHENGRHTLVLADSIGSHAPFPGYDTISYLAPTRGSTEGEHIRDWRMEQEVKTGTYAHNDYDFTNPKKRLLASSRRQRPNNMSDFEVYDYPGHYTRFKKGEDWAKVRIEELQARHQVVQGQSDARGIAPGYTFTLSNHSRSDQNKAYLVFSVSHEYVSDEFQGGDLPSGQGDLYSCTFRAIDEREQYRAPRLTAKPLVEGPQTAVVVGKAGEEIWTDQYGRVKVQFHWDRYGRSDENSSCWVRVSHGWAGGKWGAIYLPRIGQEVIVEFLEGDPDRPIITGRVYNGQNMPPYELPAEKTKSTLKSNSSKGGEGFNEIRFEDKKGDEQIFVHGEKDQDVRIKNDRREWIGHDRHLIVKNDKFEQVENNRHEKVVANHQEEIDKDRHLRVVGKEAKEVGQTLSLSVSGNVIEEFGANHSEETTQTYSLKAMGVHIEASTGIELKCGGSSIVLTPAAIFIKGGPLVNVNTGSGPPVVSPPAMLVSPQEPDAPAVADKAKPGAVETTEDRSQQETVRQAPPKVNVEEMSPAAKVLKDAAEDGTPFCEECEKAGQGQTGGGST